MARLAIDRYGVLYINLKYYFCMKVKKIGVRTFFLHFKNHKAAILALKTYAKSCLKPLSKKTSRKS